MKKLWLLGLALPLAGCAQRAELAPRQNATPPGPFTLRYHFDPQQPDRYHVTATGDTTTSFIRSDATPSSTTPANPPAGSSVTGSTASKEAVHATFQTDMVVNRTESPATASADATSDSTGITAPGTGTTGSNSPADSGTALNAPASETTNSPGATDTTGNSGTTGTTGTDSTTATNLPSRIDQKIDQWNASVTLPDRKAPNQFQGSYRDNSVSVTTGGIPMPVPDRFKTQLQNSLQQPVNLTVTDLGEIRNVQWTRPAMTTDSNDTRPIGFLTRSTAALNLWAGVIRLPDHPVNIGDSWDANDSFPVQNDTSGATVHLERTGHYILRNVTQDGADEVAVVDANETLKLMPGPVPATSPTTTSDHETGNSGATSSGATSGTTNSTNTNTPATSPSDSSSTSAPEATHGNSPSDSTTGTGSSAATGSSATTASDANALAVQTRSGSVYFDITRGWVDHTDEQFTLRWGNQFMAGTNNAAPATAHQSEGQAQGKVTVQRVDTGFTLAPSAGASSAANVPTASGTGSPSAPPASAPTANVPAPTAKTPAPTTGSASNTPATP